jgi:hypothetical protein
MKGRNRRDLYRSVLDGWTESFFYIDIGVLFEYLYFYSKETSKEVVTSSYLQLMVLLLPPHFIISKFLNFSEGFENAPSLQPGTHLISVAGTF